MDLLFFAAAVLVGLLTVAVAVAGVRIEIRISRSDRAG